MRAGARYVFAAMNVLTIESRVAWGHVGNAVAVFCLQRLGIEAWPIDTVTFSNHPGHGGFRGRVTPAIEIQDIVQGIAERGWLGRVDAVLTGYLGDASQGPALRAAVGTVKSANPGALWLLDPVMGDRKPGQPGRVFVKPGIPEFFAEIAPLADILTPNETEFAFLLRERYGQAVAPTYWELADAQLHALCRATGIPTVVITLGDKGCFVSHAEAATRGDAEPYYRLPAEPARCVDTTGAGDAYSGGLAAGLVHFAGQPFRRAATHANRVAALSVEQPGTAPAMPTREAVRARFGD